MTKNALQELLENRDRLREKLDELNQVLLETLDNINSEEAVVAYQSVLQERDFISEKLVDAESKIELLSHQTTTNRTITLEIDGKVKDVSVVSTGLADSTMGLISNTSPLGQALEGKSVGEVFTFYTPNGYKTCKLISIN